MDSEEFHCERIFFTQEQRRHLSLKVTFLIMLRTPYWNDAGMFERQFLTGLETNVLFEECQLEETVL